MKKYKVALTTKLEDSIKKDEFYFYLNGGSWGSIGLRKIYIRYIKLLYGKIL